MTSISITASAFIVSIMITYAGTVDVNHTILADAAASDAADAGAGKELDGRGLWL